MNDVQGLGTGGDTQGQGTDGGTQNPFLEGVDEADREIVGKYIDQWDQGVQKRFQELNGAIEGYKGIGSAEDFKAAKQLYDLVASDPQYVYDQLKAHLKIQDPTPQGPSNPPAGGGGLLPGQQQQTFQELPKEVQERFDKQEKLLQQVTQAFLSDRASAQQKQEEAELDNYLKALHGEHGDFDDEWFMIQVNKGTKPEDAIAAFQKMTGQGTPRTPSPPPFGGGSPQGQQQNVAGLNKSQTVDLVTQMLQSAQE